MLVGFSKIIEVLNSFIYAQYSQENSLLQSQAGVVLWVGVVSGSCVWVQSRGVVNMTSTIIFKRQPNASFLQQILY